MQNGGTWSAESDARRREIEELDALVLDLVRRGHCEEGLEKIQDRLAVCTGSFSSVSL